MGSRKNLETISRNLFQLLREFDKLDEDIILAEGIEESGIGKAIMNRMKKAAGENIVYLDDIQTLTNKTLAQPKVNGLVETRVALAANNIDVSQGAVFTKTISGATTLIVSGAPAAGKVSSFILKLTNGGSAVVTWWAGIKWDSGTAPTLTVSGKDNLAFYTDDGGATWEGFVLSKDSK